jgi:hypothetical protein
VAAVAAVGDAGAKDRLRRENYAVKTNRPKAVCLIQAKALSLRGGSLLSRVSRFAVGVEFLLVSVYGLVIGLECGEVLGHLGFVGLYSSGIVGLNVGVELLSVLVKLCVVCFLLLVVGLELLNIRLNRRAGCECSPSHQGGGQKSQGEGARVFHGTSCVLKRL